MTGNQDAFQKEMNSGHSAAWDQDWKQAASHYQAALAISPEHPQALSSLALALLELQDVEGALGMYQRAAAAAPDDPVPTEKMSRIYEGQNRIELAVKAGLHAAEVYLKNRDVEKALQNWSQVLSMMPANATARTRLATIYDKLGRKADAVKEYLALASIMQAEGNLPRAAQLVQYSIQLLPDSVEANAAVQLLQSNLQLPRPERPRGGTGPIKSKEVKHLPSVEPEEPATPDPITEARQKALVELAAILFDQPDDQPVGGQVARRGITALTRGTGGLSLDQGDRTRILLHLSQAIESQTQGNDAQAAEELSRAVEIGFTRPAILFDLGALLVNIDPPAALRHLQASVKHPDYALGSYLLLGKLHRAAGRSVDAAQAYIQALRLADVQTVAPIYADELSQLYEPMIEAQEREPNMETLDKICDSVEKQLVRPSWRRYLKTARQQLPMESPNSPPLPLAEMLLESRSTQVVEALANVRRLSAQSKLQSAMEEAFHALQFAPTYLPLHIQIGELLAKEGRTQEAVLKFMLVSQLYNLRGEATQAIRLLERVLQLAPMDLSMRSQLIELLTAQGRMDDAIQQYMDLAGIYYSLAELDMARQTYTSALRLAQQSPSGREWPVKILTSIADIDMQRLDLRQAHRMLEQVRTLQPDNADIRRQLIDLNLRMGQDSAAMTELDGYLSLLETSGKRTAGIPFMLSVVADYPERLELRKRLADLYVRNGEIEKAVSELDTLADGLVNRGNRAGAIAIVQAIIGLNPPNVADYRQVLQELRG